MDLYIVEVTFLNHVYLGEIFRSISEITTKKSITQFMKQTC